MQFLTFQKSPKYGFEPGFPLLLQRLQVQQNRCLNFIVGRIRRARLLILCAHNFHRLPLKEAFYRLARQPTDGYNFAEEFL